MPTDVINRPMSRFNGHFAQELNTEKPNNDPLAYQNLTVVKKLSKGKFPVYLVNSKINNQSYAMKVFTENVHDSDMFYQNELRFSFLKHPNIIDILTPEVKPTVQKDYLRVSYVLSEYAPHGDLFDFVVTHRDNFDEKLARTFFRQLMNGIEYLHSLGIAHLDLKPENVLIGADFNLKIADFDLSYVASDEKVLSKGTKLYRAPELYNATKSYVELEQPSAADIYSAGIILFILKCAGVYPHSENRVIEGVNFTELMEKNNSKFWTKHSEIQEKPKSFFDSKFKDLFSSMVKSNPQKRTTIKKIKESKWYNGPVYTPEELTQRMKAILKC